MKTTVSIYDFRREFDSIRPNNFSYEGLSILFDYLEQYEADCGEELELDVIALCCDFCEENYQIIADTYDIELSDCEDNEEKIARVLDYLSDNGYGSCGVTEELSIVYRVF